jgi:hypothetical protein
MAKVKSMGYTDTPIAGVSSLNFSRGLLNFSSDFRVKSNNAGKEVVLTNITSPVDRPEKIRIAYSDVANVYNGSGIEASVLAPTKRGVSVLAQITETISVTDDTDPDYRIDLPVSYHVVIKVPASEHISATDIQAGLGRLLSGLYDTGATTTSRLEAILRGSLVPSEV